MTESSLLTRPDPTDLLACPMCGARLAPAGRGMVCTADRTEYGRDAAGLLDLRPAAIRADADAFAATYRSARLAEGWQPLSQAAALALPEGNPPGFTRLYWQVRRESWAALRSFLAESGASSLTLADAGAGFPWLSGRLANLGHQVVAFDLSGDADFGLGAARLYGQPDLLPVLGSLEAPPLAAGRFDAVICNASLHYVNDLTACLTQLARALCPGGALIVVDSPIAQRNGRAGHAHPGSRVLGRAELDPALRAAGLTPRWRRVRRGWLWQRHQLKNWLLRRPIFDFPMIVGRKGGGEK
jgi:SAM-dependent methyltransferase